MFFRERLSPEATWVADSRIIVLSGVDTSTGTGLDTLSSISCGADFATEVSPFAPSLELLAEPVSLASTDFDSVKINKTRTRVNGIMCWKFKIYIGADLYSAFLSGDGLFRLMGMERKGRGKSKSDDRWEFDEVTKGKDLPIKITRTVEFEWGGEPVEIISTRELTNFRPVAPADNAR